MDKAMAQMAVGEIADLPKNVLVYLLETWRTLFGMFKS